MCVCVCVCVRARVCVCVRAAQVFVVLLNLFTAVIVETFEKIHEQDEWKLSPQALEGTYMSKQIDQGTYTHIYMRKENARVQTNDSRYFRYPFTPLTLSLIMHTHALITQSSRTHHALLRMSMQAGY